MAVLAHQASALVPLIGGLVDQGQVAVEQGVAGQQETHEHQEAQHEDDAGEGEE